MVRADAFIFGYRRVKIAEEYMAIASSILLRSGIISDINSDGSIIVRERDIDKMRKAFGKRISYEMSGPLGIFGCYKRVRHKKSIAVAVAIGIILSLICSNTVWDIRVEGNETVPDAAIVSALSECGFSLGDFWPLLERGKIESNLLARAPSISWVNLNRRGSVAYVKVIEKEGGEYIDEEEKGGYANIVANADCVIEEITVERGIALVKPGDVVKRGDLLICGITSGSGDGAPCYANGRVVGRLSDSVSVFVGREYEKRVRVGERLLEYNINFFNFSINIFKLYGNSAKECDIIENVKVCSLFGKKRLPCSLTSKYEIEYDTQSARYTDDLIVSVAGDRLSSAVLKRLAGCDLLSIKTDGCFTADGYTMKSDLTFLAEIGVAREFTVE